MIESRAEPGRADGPAGVPRSVTVVLNPRAGRGAAYRKRVELEQALAARGVPFEVRLTEAKGHASVLAEEAAHAGVEVVVACGGDGTVNEVASGLLRAGDDRSDVPSALAVVPVGTGNDFAKMLGVTGGLAHAVEAIAAGRLRRFDSGAVEWAGGSGVFVNAMGTGIDVEVVRQILRGPKLPGALPYILGLIRALRRYDPIPVRVKADGRRIETKVMMVAVSNGRCVGGAFRICPVAEPDDGLFDVCVIDAVPLLRTPALAARILAGRHVGDPAVELVRASAVEIEVPEGTPLFFQLDGELHEPRGAHSVRITLRPGALRVRAAR